MIETAYYPIRFGILKIECEAGRVVRLEVVKEIGENAKTSELSDRVYLQIEEYLNGNRRDFDFPYLLRGTEFQERVWKELCNIPYGETRSYKQIAEAIGNPAAGRAVGMACNRNPIQIVVPCHRVVGADGTLTGYAGGLAMKEELLSLEKCIKVPEP